MRSDRRKLLSLANGYKKLAIAYRFNNWKLQQIAALQSSKRQLYKGVGELKMKLQIWKQMVMGGTTGA